MPVLPVRAGFAPQFITAIYAWIMNDPVRPLISPSEPDLIKYYQARPGWCRGGPWPGRQ